MTERQLYPAIEPFETGFLQVPDGHNLYYELSGNPEGKPAVFLHGGPGGGTSPQQRRFFDPRRYLIILFDQRGAGKSTPHASLEHNTTQDLVADIELLRQHLGIKRWQVFGGSWGSTLALAYAQAHPEPVTELVLRGIFLFRQKEMDWFYRDGTRRLFPDLWEEFIAPIPEAERDDIIGAYYRRLTGPNEAEKITAAKAWCLWENRTITLSPDEALTGEVDNVGFALAFARIEAHYFINGGFIAHENQLLEDCSLIQHIPTIIVHGRYDAICPCANAWDLKQVLPQAELRIIPASGHSAFEPGIASALVEATDQFLKATD